MNEPKLRFKADDGSDFPDWNDELRLEDISSFITKGATPTTYGFEWQTDGVCFFRNDSIKNNVFIYGDYSYISEEANEFLKRSEIKAGDIIIAITGDIGKVGMVPRNIKKANINQHLARVRIERNAVPYFIYMFLCTEKIQKKYKKIKTGLSMPQLSLNQIRKTTIPVVALPEQQKIADFLSTIDTVIEKQKATVEAWEERKTGVMQKLFSQEVRFKADDGSEFPDWEEKKLGELFDVSAGGDIDKNNSSDMKSDDFPYKVFANALADNGLYGYANYYKIDGDSFTITGRGDVGHAVARHEKYVPIVRLLVCKPKHNENVDFFTNCFNTRRIFIESTGVPQLTAPQVINVKMVVPCLPEQQKIADCLSSLDDVIEKQKATLAAWEEMKKGLLQQMFI